MLALSSCRDRVDSLAYRPSMATMHSEQLDQRYEHRNFYAIFSRFTMSFRVDRTFSSQRQRCDLHHLIATSKPRQV
jgi:hypothetical protein